MADQNQSLDEPSLPIMTEAEGQKPLKTSRFGIASLVFSIAAIFTFGLTSPLGLICGIISIIQIKMNKESLGGRSYAVSGIISSIIIMAFITLIVILRIPVQNGHKTIACLSNLKFLGTAMMMYMNENDECLPSYEKWVDSISIYVKND